MISSLMEKELVLPRGVTLAEYSDADDMAATGKEFFDATILPRYASYDTESMSDTIVELIERESGVVYCMKDKGLIVGGIGGYVHPLYFNHCQMAAQQVFWFVLPEHRSRKSLRLLSAWESWAANFGAKVIWSGAKMDNNYDGMKAMMERRKYAALEVLFIREV